jgi:hypothetical protein
MNLLALIAAYEKKATNFYTGSLKTAVPLFITVLLSFIPFCKV